MSLSLYIARRYLFSKKKHNAVNIISAISVCGVALATLALVCTLSVFNGFQEMVAELFTNFDPQLKITVNQGKVFHPEEMCIKQLETLPEVEMWMPVLEENAMVRYRDNQLMVTIKGVQDDFRQLTEIDNLLLGAPDFVLQDELASYGVAGVQVLSQLGSGLAFVDPLEVYAPKRNIRVNIANPATAFNKEYLYSPGTAFMVGQDKYDAHYILTSIHFARRLFNYTDEVSAIEVKLKPGSHVEAVKKKMQQIAGERFSVKDRYEQQEDVYKIMKIEKFLSYIFLTFILIVATFNVVGSLSMLIADKQENVETLRNLGADRPLIIRIFFMEGILITLTGVLAGIVSGVACCVLQQQFGLITLGNGQDFLVDAYPVSIHFSDLVLIFVTVTVTSVAAVLYPVHYLSKQPATEG